VEINLVIVSLCEILVNALTDTNIIALDRAKYALVLSQKSRAVRGECRASNYRTRQKMKIYCPKVCCERGELYRQ